MQENELKKYILKASDIYLAFQYARMIEIEYPVAWDTNEQASKDWYYAFMNRHRDLSLRTPEQISQNRAKSFNEANVNAFFDNLSKVMTETKFEPHRIWNMDECGLPTVPTKTVKTIARKGQSRNQEHLHLLKEALMCL